MISADRVIKDSLLTQASKLSSYYTYTINCCSNILLSMIKINSQNG